MISWRVNMGITYGYCGEPSISWKLKYSSASVGSCLPGKMNVMLTRNIKESIPAWLEQASGSPYDEIKDWIYSLLCDDDHIPSSASLNIQAVEQYRWRPKEAAVVEDSVINYNEPCSSHKKRRKISRMQITASIEGTGGISCDTFESTLDTAYIAIQALSGLTLDEKDWFIESCSSERSINDWHKYSLSARTEIGEPTTYPDWTAISVSISGLEVLETSTLTISSTQIFTDQSPTDVDLESVSTILQSEADVLNCPTESGGIFSRTWVNEFVWPKL